MRSSRRCRQGAGPDPVLRGSSGPPRWSRSSSGSGLRANREAAATCQFSPPPGVAACFGADWEMMIAEDRTGPEPGEGRQVTPSAYAVR